MEFARNVLWNRPPSVSLVLLKSCVQQIDLWAFPLQINPTGSRKLRPGFGCWCPHFPSLHGYFGIFLSSACSMKTNAFFKEKSLQLNQARPLLFNGTVTENSWRPQIQTWMVIHNWGSVWIKTLTKMLSVSWAFIYSPPSMPRLQLNAGNKSQFNLIALLKTQRSRQHMFRIKQAA